MIRGGLLVAWEFDSVQISPFSWISCQVFSSGVMRDFSIVSRVLRVLRELFPCGFFLKGYFESMRVC